MALMEIKNNERKKNLNSYLELSVLKVTLICTKNQVSFLILNPRISEEIHGVSLFILLFYPAVGNPVINLHGDVNFHTFLGPDFHFRTEKDTEFPPIHQGHIN